MKRAIQLSVSAALLLGPAFGYIRSTNDTGSYFLQRNDNKGIQYYINSRIAPGATAPTTNAKVIADGSDPVTAIREAMITWNRSGAAIKFLAAKPTDSTHDSGDGKNVVVIAATAADAAALNGAIAITANVWYGEKGQSADGKEVNQGDIADSDIIMSPVGAAGGLLFSTDGSTAVDLQAVMTHEFGHALGENHVGLLGATMYPFSNLSQRYLSADEVAFANAVYPAANSSQGTISGTITLGSAGVKRAQVALIDTSTGVAVSTLTDTAGKYSVRVPPGRYIVYAEPFNSLFQAGNLYYIDPAQVTTGYQPTLAGGAASPTQTTVAAGATATVDITVTAAGTGLTPPFVATGGAGGRADITSVNGIAGAIFLTSGRSLDLALLGGGVDATTTIQVLGGGVTVRAGTTRVDTSVNFSAGPLVRVTLDVAARETPALATLLLTKGSATLAFSGLFMVVPPKPVFTSKSVVNAASYVGLNGDGVVSPGGLYSIYAATGSALGPAAFAQNGPYDDYGKLANSLAGVNVTFDGIQAPMFLSFSGQLNVQVPFEVAGKRSTVVQVNFNGALSDKITVPVVNSQPAFFTITPTGDDSIAGNQDFSLNSASNPEARGRVVSIYGTGLGKLSYDVATGTGAGGPPAGYTGNNTCTLGTKSVPVAFTGWTPSAVGLGQWSLVIPSDAPTGKVAVKCTDANGNSTQAGTLYIK